ncbi:uroporphyrinogen-III synthase [Candidatus Thioglobus sp.]|uniref:uroporphyrinogen-III synthase n=1 Tax=Candidatus Thioglobus sp. TaxID=2026721 RepID=UPI003D11F8FB
MQTPLKVLLTRPLTQVKALESLIVDSGHQPLLFPTLEVKAIEASVQHKQYDAVIFISANAATHGLALLNTIKPLKVFAVGAATAKKLNDYGVYVDDFPKENASSEALLALDSVSCLHAKNILIFRGKGGRETLRIGLQKNQNQVEYVEVYERITCALTPAHRNSLTEFMTDSQGIISITSNENIDGLLALVKQLGCLEPLMKYPLVVLSQRIQKYALSLGFTQVIVTTDTSDEAIASVLESMNTLDN